MARDTDNIGSGIGSSGSDGGSDGSDSDLSRYPDYYRRQVEESQEQETGGGGGGTSGDATEPTDYNPVQGPGIGTQPGEPTETPTDTGETTDTGDGGTDDSGAGTGNGYNPVQGPGLGTQPGEPTETPTDTDGTTDDSTTDTGGTTDGGDAGGAGDGYNPVQGPGIGTQPGEPTATPTDGDTDYSQSGPEPNYTSVGQGLRWEADLPEGEMNATEQWIESGMPTPGYIPQGAENPEMWTEPLSDEEVAETDFAQDARPTVERGGRYADVPESAAADPFSDDPRVPDYYEDQIERDQPQSVDQPFLEENQGQPGEFSGDTPGDVIGTNVESGGVEGATPIDASSAQLQRQARNLERQLLLENPNLGPREVDINLTRVDGEYQFRPEFTDQFRRESAASAFREQTGADVNVGDIQLGDDAPQLREETQRELAAERASEQTGADISPADIVIEGGQARVSEEVQREITAGRTEQQLEQQFGADFDREDVAVEYRDRQVFQSRQNRPTQVRQRGYFGQLSDEGAAQVVASQIDLPESTIEAGEDFQRTDSGIELTAEGRQRAIEAELIERGEVTVEREGTEIPVIGGRIGGGEETIDIRRPEQQLEFDEEGNLENIQPAEYTQADIEANERRLARTIGFGPVGDVVAGGAGYLAKGTDVAADVSTDVGAGIQEQVLTPGAELAGDIQSTYAETTDVINPLSDEFASQEGIADVVRAGGDIARGEEDEVSEETFVETATEKTASGGLSVVRFGVELPATIQSGALVAGEAAEFTAESVTEEGFVGGAVESGAAAGGAAVDVGEQVAAQTIQNPYATVGTLAGSGAIMGGAAAVGTRTGLATRLAIQPGEELLGYGGAGTLRRLPGQRTTRAAETLFPNNEPLLFSEEAAISAGQRVAGGLQNVGGRVRSAELSDLSLSGLRSTFGETRQQLPSARVTTAGEGRVSLSDPMKRDIRLGMGAFDRGVAANVVSARNRIRDLPESARSRIRDLPEAAREQTKRSAVRAQNLRQDFPGQRTMGAALSADRALLGSLVRTQNVRADAPDMIDRAVRSGAVQAMNRRQDLSIAARTRLAEGAVNLEQDVLATGVRAQNLRQDIGIAARQEGAIRATNVHSGLVEAGVRAQNLRADAPSAVRDRALRSAVQAQNVRADSPDIGERVSGVTDTAAESAAETAIRARNLRQDIGIAARQETATRATNIRTGMVEAGVRAQNLRADAPDAIDQTVRSGAVQAMNRRQDLSIAARTRLAEGAVNLEQDVLATGVRAQNLRQDVPDNIREAGLRTGVRAQNLRQDLSNLGVVIEPGKPSRTVRASEMDVPDDVGIEFEGEAGTQDPFKPTGDFEQASVGPAGGGAPTVEVEGDSGVAVQRVVQRDPIETDAPDLRTEGERGAVRTQPFADDIGEPTVDTAQVGQPELDATQAPTVAETFDPVEGVTETPTQGTELFDEIRSGIEGRQRTETETDTRQELFQELETETETETETEMEIETELRYDPEEETRRERERDEDTEAQELRPAAATEEDVGALFADFRDPLTGELLRTERENIGVRDI